MRKVAHIAMIIFLALYAASAVAHSVNASVMKIEMVASEEADMEMSDCLGCDVDEDAAAGPACDMVCTSPFAATFPASPGLVLTAPLPLERRISEVQATGRTGSPEPFPPRTLS